MSLTSNYKKKLQANLAKNGLSDCNRFHRKEVTDKNGY